MADVPTPERETLTAEPARSRPGPESRNRIIGGAVLGVLLLAIAFLAGRATGSDQGTTGPTTLAAAVQQARSGTLACGDLKALPRAVQQLCPTARSTTTAAGTSTSVRAAGAPVARNLLVGIVQSLNGDQLVLQTAAPQPVTLVITPQTAVNTAVKGSTRDVIPGAHVIVRPSIGRGPRAATVLVVVPAEAIAPPTPATTAPPTSKP